MHYFKVTHTDNRVSYFRAPSAYELRLHLDTLVRGAHLEPVHKVEPVEAASIHFQELIIQIPRSILTATERGYRHGETLRGNGYEDAIGDVVRWLDDNKCYQSANRLEDARRTAKYCVAFGRAIREFLGLPE